VKVQKLNQFLLRGVAFSLIGNQQRPTNLPHRERTSPITAGIRLSGAQAFEPSTCFQAGIF
jgi:hypothetical protein